MSTFSLSAELPRPVATAVEQAWSRIHRYLKTHAARAITDATADDLADQLWRHATDHPYGARPGTDPRIAAVTGAIHWFRHQSRPGGDERDEDLDRALIMFRQLHDYGPELLPPDVHQLLHEQDDDDADAAHFDAIGVRLLQKYATSGDLSAIDEAATMMRRAVDASPEESILAARHLTNLCGALLMRFNVRHRTEDLRAAVEAGRRATEIRSTWGGSRAAAQANYAVALIHAADLPDLTDDATLRTAVDHCRGALLSITGDDPQVTAYRKTLISVGRAVFERTLQWSDLQTALDLAEWTPSRSV